MRRRRSDRETLELSSSAVRDELGRILEYEDFRASERLPRFLKFIVEETLAGRGSKLKGYVIGLEVFDKSPDFNPEQDSVVRVEAVRLRRALNAYYLSEGAGNPVVIEVPKGSYRPVFHARAGMSVSQETPVTATWTRERLLAGTAALAFFLAVGGGTYWIASHSHEGIVTGSIEGNNSHFHKALALPSGPKLAVLPFSAIGMGEEIRIAQAFHAQLISDLTRFDLLAVIGAETTSRYFGQVGDLQPIAEQYNAQYVLTGTLQVHGGALRVLTSLYDSANRQYIWSTVFDREFDVAKLLSLQSELSAQVAAQIGQAYGVINRAQTRDMLGNRPNTLSAYQCVLEFYDYLARKSAARHAAARACLERAVKSEPEYADAWAALAWIYRDEAALGFNRGRQSEPPLVRGENAARTAVRLAPDNATAHYALAAVLFSNDERAGAEEQLSIALSLNPNDVEILAGAGQIFAKLGQWKLARKLIEKAAFLNPGHPPWYDGVLFTVQFHNADYEKALEYALEYRRENSLYSHVALTATYGKLGRTAESSQALAALLERYPNFPNNPRLALADWGYPESFVDNCLDGLRKAGLVNLL